MPNRRRCKLSTAISTVATLAIASPCAYFLVYEPTASAKPAAKHYEFKQAASIADLPGEVLDAISQGLSQFGINLPPVPSLTGTDDPGNGLRTPGLTSPDLTNQELGTPVLTAPGTGLTPPVTGSPICTAPDLNLGGTCPSEVPITTPISLDPGTDGTYPILGDPSTLGGTSPISTSSGELVNDLLKVANQLGASQVMDLIKGVVMPAVMQGVQNGNVAGDLSGSVTPAAISLIPVT
ncbi:28 kDa antigen precursor [Mycobacterium leprae Kyoto-2]|uniref:28 kDa antigen n=3 Tax=Mycobacterium leprae TaxID=1769 RepID=28KD_MYCLE|nr:hypothetical protein [Mycobacterium leprae]P19361.1 RecName: Full=28 kDa antigen; Flags: Precursor [Mycobacterium leprae TN]CAR70184.1 28 KDa antigen precursor [Mycobacterium leprae Br4923]AAA25345.1 28-kDa protein precursor (gtg start codon) [Mycobacterium leprae]AWV47091.1 hypothetical protein DIJ64_00470 [Mycobacterium leprae]OAR21307.1 hypothetical protein A8144_06785 [Mycobacterium leprae 3125609]OAX71392.1 hypothetical protein A3216_05960 [Mycobacterium leprae 7935681]